MWSSHLPVSRNLKRFRTRHQRTDKYRLGAHRKPKRFSALEKAPERAVVAEKLTRIPEEPEFITMSFDESASVHWRP
jgi:hypothetical protein